MSMLISVYCPVCSLPLSESGADQWKILNNLGGLPPDQLARALRAGSGHVHYVARLWGMTCTNGHGPFDIRFNSLMYVGDPADGGKSEMQTEGVDLRTPVAAAELRRVKL